MDSEFQDFISNITAEFSTFKTEAYSFFKEFYNSVTWSDPFITYLGIGYVLWLVLIIVFAKYVGFQIFAFAIESACIFGAKFLNSLAHQYWSTFSSQDYFDESGLFITMMWSFPILIIASIQVIVLTCTTAIFYLKLKNMQKYSQLLEEEAKLKQVQKQLDMVEKEAEKLESTLEEESVPSEETTVKHRKGKKH